MKKTIPVSPQTEKPPVISFMTLALHNLFRLQGLDFDETPARHAKTLTAELRSQIPASLLDRYDRLRARDKKAIAIVLNSACTACHMRQPTGKVAALLRGDEIQVCDSCGRYLLLPEPATGHLAASVAAAHPAAHRAGSARAAISSP